MITIRFGDRTAAISLALALTATACAGGGSSKAGPGAASGAGAPGVRGGTLSLLMNSDFPHLDPARNYINTSLDFSRLLYRTLTTYKSLPGAAGTKVVGDLATDSGTPSDGGKTWKFTLRNGLRYEDGTAITVADIKYGVERSFDPDLPEGNQYLQQFLAGVPAGYEGPKKSAGKELDSIVVVGKTITFRLKRPVGDFSYTAAEPNVSPVPQTKDTGIQYDRRPFSSGPYKVDSYTRGKSLTLIRNSYWSRKSDSVRSAFPDKVVCTFGLDPTSIDQRLIADSPQDQTATGFDTSLLPESIPQALSSPATRRRAVIGYTNGSRYLAINVRKVPNLKVRQAIEYAVDKETYRTARGGTYAGDYLSSNIVPTTLGFKKFDLYPAPPQGDPARARLLLAAAGVTAPRVTLATPNTSKGIAAAVAIQSALKRATIAVNIQQLAGDVFYDVVSDTAKEPDLALVGWGPDWPSASTVIPPLFDGRQIKPQGNVNWSQLNNPAINAEIDRINANTNIAKQAAQWGALDEEIMRQAPVVPLLAEKSVDLHGSRVTGAYVHGAFGLLDLVSLGVRT